MSANLRDIKTPRAASKMMIALFPAADAKG
jgi:hypothetical protein